MTVSVADTLLFIRSKEAFFQNGDTQKFTCLSLENTDPNAMIKKQMFN